MKCAKGHEYDKLVCPVCAEQKSHNIPMERMIAAIKNGTPAIPNPAAEVRVSQIVTHRCERCGREYIWVNPLIQNPVDRFGVLDGRGGMDTCKGRLVSVNDFPFAPHHASDVPWTATPQQADWRITK